MLKKVMSSFEWLDVAANSAEDFNIECANCNQSSWLFGREGTCLDEGIECLCPEGYSGTDDFTDFTDSCSVHLQLQSGLHIASAAFTALALVVNFTVAVVLYFRWNPKILCTCGEQSYQNTLNSFIPPTPGNSSGKTNLLTNENFNGSNSMNNLAKTRRSVPADPRPKSSAVQVQALKHSSEALVRPNRELHYGNNNISDGSASINRLVRRNESSEKLNGTLPRSRKSSFTYGSLTLRRTVRRTKMRRVFSLLLCLSCAFANLLALIISIMAIKGTMRSTAEHPFLLDVASGLYIGTVHLSSVLWIMSVYFSLPDVAIFQAMVDKISFLTRYPTVITTLLPLWSVLVYIFYIVVSILPLDKANTSKKITMSYLFWGFLPFAFMPTFFLHELSLSDVKKVFNKTLEVYKLTKVTKDVEIKAAKLSLKTTKIVRGLIYPPIVITAIEVMIVLVTKTRTTYFFINIYYIMIAISTILLVILIIALTDGGLSPNVNINHKRLQRLALNDSV